MAIVYLGLGTNLGDKAANLHAAVHLISEKIGKVISLSSFYATAPWGFESENSFLNKDRESDFPIFFLCDRSLGIRVGK